MFRRPRRVCERGLSTSKHQNASRLSKSGSAEVDIDLARGNQKVDVIRRSDPLGLLEDLLQRHGRTSRHIGKNSLEGGRGNASGIKTKIIFQKLHLPLKDPVDLSRESYAVLQPQRARIIL